MKNVACCHLIWRHAELVSASVNFGVSTLGELDGKIHNNTDAETNSA